MQFKFEVLLCFGVSLSPLVGSAQPWTVTPNPTNPNVLVPPVKYESGFTHYVPQHDIRLVPWREVNDDVARAGGHAGIFRSAVNAGDAPIKPPTPAK